MSAVIVQRCVLRIRRTSGWSWGDSPDALLAASSRVLPELIGARLRRAVPAAAGSVRITAPLRVRVEATLAELNALAGELDGHAASDAATPLAQRLGAALEAALEAALARALEGADPRTDAQAAAAPALDATRTTEVAAGTTAEDTRTASARRALRAWGLGSDPRQVFARLDAASILALHDLVFALAPAAADRVPDGVALIAERAAQALGAYDAAPLEVLRARLAIAARVLASATDAPSRVLRAAVDAVLAAPDVSALRAELQAHAAAPALGAPRALPDDLHAEPAAPVRPATPRTVESSREIEVRSALPFLLLSSLHHAGWLDAASTLLHVHDAGDAAFALASALAGRLLDPPERGWMRSREERSAIAAFAGCAEPIDDASVLAAATRLAPILPALDATLHDALARARKPGAAYVVWRSERGWSLLDADDLVVLDAAATLVPPPQGSLVIVPASCADRAVLDRLDLANVRFVTDAPPARGEAWRRFAGVARPLWTNDAETPSARLSALTADLDSLIAHVAELIEVVDARPAIPRVPPSALETSVTLAATAALSDMAARLFPAERTTPVLAWTRFRDLDARIRFDADCVRVRIPLGRRHADLMRHGFLTTIPRVPWLSGRAVDLGGA